MNISPIFAGLLLAALAPATLVACGGDDTDPSTSGTGGGTGGGSSSGTGAGTGGGADFDFAKYCEDLDAKSVECGNPADPEKVERCKAAESCFRGGYKPEAQESLLACFLDRPCGGGSDDACYLGAGDAAPKGAAFDAYLAACTASDCPEETKAELCTSFINILKDEIIEDVTACFASGCATLDACFETALAPVEGCFDA